MAATPEEYIAELDEPRRGEISRLDALIREALPDAERVLDRGIIGYGPFHYRYASGREGDSALIGLSSRKRSISLYVLCTDDGAYLAERYADRLPKADVGKSCIRFKRTEDVDLGVLRELLGEAARIGPPSAA